MTVVKTQQKAQSSSSWAQATDTWGGAGSFWGANQTVSTVNLLVTKP
jgi:hypothetical protein